MQIFSHKVVSLSVRLTLVAVAAAFASYSRGQDFESRPRSGPQQPVAIAGHPFGVLIAEVPLPPGFEGRLPRILVENSDGRVFYPVVSIREVEVLEEPARPSGIGRRGGLLDRVRSAVRGEPKKTNVPVAVTVAALYRGEQPIDLRLAGDIEQTIRIESSVADPQAYRQLLNTWWRSYTQSAADAIAAEDFPKLIHQYLTATLSDRLSLPRVDLDPPDPEKEELSQPLETLALLAAIEPMREKILQDVLNFPGDDTTATQPVPPEPTWGNRPVPPIAGNVEIESLATRVPPECFYLRFGAFSNYVWLQDIGERYGGDIAQAVLLRGFNYEASARMERMLAAKMTAIAKMFGDKLIGDMAVIGTDLYMKEGASLGVVFYAKNPRLLNAAIESDRRAIAAKNDDARIEELDIQGHKVIFLGTPDNRIRSFYVNDGDYVLVTTSRTLVERFLQVGAGDRSLADTLNFKAARAWMPEANDYSVFAYFSPEFFHRLVSPQYQIELRRRLEAIAHLEIAEVASQVAQAEGLVNDDIGLLQANGLLPAWFDGRADGAATLRSKDTWIDSLRGARGSFLPIADVKLTSVTRREEEQYATIAAFYQEQWQHMDPLVVGLRRFKADGSNVEKVAFEAYVSPFDAEKYGWIAKQLGAPTPVVITQPSDNAASVQFHVRGSSVLGTEDYHLFGGVKDMVPPSPEDTDGLIKTLQALRSTPAYIGAWPKPGMIEQLPLGLGRALAQPDYAGFSRMLGGLWRWQDGAFSLLSFNRAILDTAIPQLSVVEATDLAQARLQVANLNGSQLASWINGIWYDRGWRSSHGNVRFLDIINQQLQVPSDECLDVAQRLLDVRLQCPLGGEFQFVPLPSGNGGWWTSSAWADVPLEENDKPVPHPEYQAPWIEWFRGGQVHVTQTPNSLAAVGEIDLEMRPLSVDFNPTVPSLLPPMNFDLFSLPSKIFGQEPAKPEQSIRKSF